MPAGWTAPQPLSAQAATGWLAEIKSAGLRKAVDEALAASPSLKEAAARLQSARWRSVSQGAERFPDLASRISAGEQYAWKDQPVAGWQNDSKYDLALNLSWELDLWGRIRDTTAAAKLDKLAAEADFQSARLSLAANVAKAWCNAVEATQLVKQAQSTLSYYQNSLNSLVGRVNRGVPGATALDEKLSRANLASAQSRLAITERRADNAHRSLEVLLGRYPAASIQADAQLPELPPTVPAGLPSSLLLRRPDVRAAEIRAASKQKQVGAAWKLLLPTLRLTASTGASSAEFTELLDPKKLVSNLATGLSQPLFRGGRLLAEAKITEAERDGLAARYAETALQAFREVETALAGEVYLTKQVTALTEYAKQASEAETMAQQNYENGQIPYVTVLEAQRRAVDSREALIQAQNAAIQNRLDLYLALGGGF